MAIPARAVPFALRLTDGRVWGGAEFPDGFVCLHHPDEPTVCTIATSLDALLADRTPGHPLHGAEVVEREWW
ncbi:hypothetical protein ACWD5Q_06600 [Streptomyces sp. NPDC002513]